MPWASRYPPEIGAGLRKRAAIARGLALAPDYVIYDEPTTNLVRLLPGESTG
jgi:ABC-type transporter Mla maintaining outer membrane lipid asymmetry ATPase subunit MlaF